jgi:hypothetical protein
MSSNHLSHDQLVNCFLGRSTNTELQHLLKCPECSADLDAFTNTISRFRDLIRLRIDAHVTAGTNIVTASPRIPTRGIAGWRWALAGAMIVALVLPFFTVNQQPKVIIESTSSETNPDVLMNAVNLHLLRTMPQPMEPILALIPTDETTSLSGGVQ